MHIDGDGDQGEIMMNNSVLWEITHPYCISPKASLSARPSHRGKWLWFKVNPSPDGSNSSVLIFPHSCGTSIHVADTSCSRQIQGWDGGASAPSPALRSLFIPLGQPSHSVPSLKLTRVFLLLLSPLEHPDTLCADVLITC